MRATHVLDMSCGAACDFANGLAQEDSDEDDFNYEDVEVDSELEDDKTEDDFEALTKAARLHDKAETVGDDIKRKVGPVCANLNYALDSLGLPPRPPARPSPRPRVRLPSPTVVCSGRRQAARGC